MNSSKARSCVMDLITFSLYFLKENPLHPHSTLFMWKELLGLYNKTKWFMIKSLVFEKKSNTHKLLIALDRLCVWGLLENLAWLFLLLPFDGKSLVCRMVLLCVFFVFVFSVHLEQNAILFSTCGIFYSFLHKCFFSIEILLGMR